MRVEQPKGERVGIVEFEIGDQENQKLRQWSGLNLDGGVVAADGDGAGAIDGSGQDERVLI